RRFRLRARLPSLQRHSGFLAGLFEESYAIPAVLARNLRQQQAAMTRHADKEAMPADFDFLGANGLELGKDTEGNFEFRSFVGSDRPEARIFKRCRPGGFRYGSINRCCGKNVAHTATQPTAMVQRCENAARLGEVRRRGE